MSPMDIDLLKASIEVKLRTLSGAVVSAKSDLRNSSEMQANVFMDELDFARAETDLQTVVGVLKRNATEDLSLRNAVVRMKNGTFGLCLYCKDEMNSRRLQAVPSAAFCLSCQEDLERGWIMCPATAGVAA